MFDSEQLRLVQSYLAAPERGEQRTSAENSAWDRFYLANRRLIRFVLRRRGVRECDVDDLTQQVWTEIVRDLGSLVYDPAAGRASGFISVIARRTAYRHVRRQSRRLDDVAITELESPPTDPGRGPLSECEWNELPGRARAILSAARSSLSDADYRMLLLRRIDERSIREIAATFLVSEECAKKRLQRALEVVKALHQQRADW
jgi:RNA polymerase sigma factor (sigma-70 family)